MSPSLKKQLTWIVGGGLVLFALIGWNLSFAWREEQRWGHCIGRSVDMCIPPENYEEIEKGCPTFLDCETDPPSIAYARAILKTGRDTVWSSYAYAVIGLDEDDRVLSVEVKRHFASL